MSTIMHPVLTPLGYAQAQEALYSDSIIVHMNAVAVVVWVGYDIALTASQEIDAMWRRRLTSIPSFMYFVTRYFGFIFLVYNAFTIISNRNTLLSCYVWGMLQAIGVQLLSLLVNGLLAFRVYAFYHGNTRMKRLILTLWILESTIEVAVTIWAKVMTGEPVPPPENMSISGCISDTAETPFLTILGWLVNIVYSVICFCLIAYRFLTVYFEECMTSGIAERFLYDGALLFVLLCGSNVVNIVLLYAVPKSPIILIGFSWFIGAGSVASSRTILSLRGGLHESKRSITEYRLSATVGGFTKSFTPWCSRHQNSPVDVFVLDPQPVLYTDSQGSSFYMQAKIGLRVSVESA